jgi:hypothetical protein
MRKLILVILAGIGLVLSVPQFASAVPVAPAGISQAADTVSTAEPVHYRRWHRRHWHHRHYWRHRHWHHRHYWRHRHWHHRHWRRW